MLSEKQEGFRSEIVTTKGKQDLNTRSKLRFVQI